MALFNFRALALVLCGVLGVSHTALSANAEVSWSNPTTYTDGTTISNTGPNALALTRIEYGTCVGTAPDYTFGTVLGEVTAPFPATSVTVTGLAAGTTVCFRAYARLASLIESAPSAVAYKDLAPPVPEPPVGLTVIELTAYNVVKKTDRFAFTPVGTVPERTACNPDERVNGYYVVPRAVVTWTGTAKPAVVVAKCA